MVRNDRMVIPPVTVSYWMLPAWEEGVDQEFSAAKENPEGTNI